MHAQSSPCLLLHITTDVLCSVAATATAVPCWVLAQVESLTDSWKRSLAEMENVRVRTTREVENSKKFAIQVRRQAHASPPPPLPRSLPQHPPPRDV